VSAGEAKWRNDLEPRIGADGDCRLFCLHCRDKKGGNVNNISQAVHRHKCSGPPREVLHIDADSDDARAGCCPCSTL
jgi:hypothetical protein